eukprot:SAG11_NODE_2557_length_3221_cov_3.516336_9_plen_39_part_01
MRCEPEAFLEYSRVLYITTALLLLALPLHSAVHTSNYVL